MYIAIGQATRDIVIIKVVLSQDRQQTKPAKTLVCDVPTNMKENDRVRFHQYANTMYLYRHDETKFSMSAYSYSHNSIKKYRFEDKFTGMRKSQDEEDAPDFTSYSNSFIVTARIQSYFHIYKLDRDQKTGKYSRDMVIPNKSMQKAQTKEGKFKEQEGYDINMDAESNNGYSFFWKDGQFWVMCL